MFSRKYRHRGSGSGLRLRLFRPITSLVLLLLILYIFSKIYSSIFSKIYSSIKYTTEACPGFGQRGQKPSNTPPPLRYATESNQKFQSTFSLFSKDGYEEIAKRLSNLTAACAYGESNSTVPKARFLNNHNRTELTETAKMSIRERPTRHSCSIFR